MMRKELQKSAGLSRDGMNGSKDGITPSQFWRSQSCAESEY